MAITFQSAGIGTLNPRASSALNRSMQNLDSQRIGHMVAPHAIVNAETFDHLTAQAPGDMPVEQIWASAGLIRQIEYGEGSFATKKLVGRGLKVKLAKRDVDEWNRKLSVWDGNGSTYVDKQIVRLRRDILDYEEYLIATKFFSAGNYATANKSTAINFSGATIFEDIQAAKDQIKKGGRAARLWTLGETSYSFLQKNATIKSYFKSPGGSQLPATLERLEELFELKIVVGSLRRNIAGVSTLFWTADASLISASDYDMAAQNFTIDDETFAATAVLPMGEQDGVANDSADYFTVLTGDPEGAEKAQEYAVVKLYDPIPLNYALGFLHTNTDQV